MTLLALDRNDIAKVTIYAVRNDEIHLTLDSHGIARLTDHNFVTALSFNKIS